MAGKSIRETYSGQTCRAALAQLFSISLYREGDDGCE